MKMDKGFNEFIDEMLNEIVKEMRKDKSEPLNTKIVAEIMQMGTKLRNLTSRLMEENLMHKNDSQSSKNVYEDILQMQSNLLQLEHEVNDLLKEVEKC